MKEPGRDSITHLLAECAEKSERKRRLDPPGLGGPSEHQIVRRGVAGRLNGVRKTRGIVDELPRLQAFALASHRSLDIWKQEIDFARQKYQDLLLLVPMGGMGARVRRQHRRMTRPGW